MSKTLEERVAALEDRIGAHKNALSDHRKVIGDIEVFVGMASPPPATSDPQEPYRLDTNDQDVLRGGGDFSLLIQDDPYDVALAEAILTSGPQEPHQPPLPQHVVDGMEWLKEQLVRARNLGTPYVVAVDPKASPKGIPFSVALEYMKAGRRVRKATWVPLAYAHNSMSLVEAGIRFMEDALANDWEVVPEP